MHECIYIYTYNVKINFGFAIEWSLNNIISYLVCFSYRFCLSSQKQNVQVVFWIGSSLHHYFYIKAIYP